MMKHLIIKGICALVIMFPLFATAAFAYPSQETSTQQSYYGDCCGGYGGRHHPAL